MKLIQAHNLAWKLAAVIKGHAIDSEKLLDSYTEEVSFLIMASDQSESQSFVKPLR